MRGQQNMKFALFTVSPKCFGFYTTIK